LLSAQGAGRRPLRLHRWCDRLFAYSFDVEYVDGGNDCVADMLSRASVESDDSNSYDVNSPFCQPGAPLISLPDLAGATTADPQLSGVIRLVRDGSPTSRHRVLVELRDYFHVRDELSCFANGCLAKGERAVIPSMLREQVLKLAHEGHPGVVKRKQRCRHSVWWPGIGNDVERLIRNLRFVCGVWQIRSARSFTATTTFVSHRSMETHWY
jgi:hypothetical protein